MGYGRGIVQCYHLHPYCVQYPAQESANYMNYAVIGTSLGRVM